MDEDKDSTFFPEEIMVEILMRLPVKPLFRFKCVSKQYQFIISDPKFAQNYLQQAYSSPGSWSSLGLLWSLLLPFRDGDLDQNIPDLTDIVNSSSDRPPIHLSSISIPHEKWNHRILGSSNGLVLSAFRAEPLKPRRFGLCVSNPLTKQCVEVPRSTELLTGFVRLRFGFATRREQDASAFLTYKIVLICRDHTVQIFSSDTGSWAAKRLACPGLVLDRHSGFAYKGVLYWLDCTEGNVITYDPFDSPDRFGRIELPNRNSLQLSSLLYSGDHEMLRYCEVVRVKKSQKIRVSFDSTSVWRLVDSDEGEWCLEGKFVDSGFHMEDWTLMVAPNPLNRSLFYIPFVKEDYLWVINSRTGKWGLIKVESTTKGFRESGLIPHENPLIPIETCPWSCPFYVHPQMYI